MIDRMILALDSSTTTASVSIAKGITILGEIFITRQKSHSEQMHTAIEQLLIKTQCQLSDIEFIVVTQGPGSFTGLRVAGNIAKTYSYIFNIPIVSICTLEALAHQAATFSAGVKLKICPMINAYKRMVFFALYDQSEEGDLVELIKPGVFTIEQLDTLITEKINCIGDAYNYYKDEFSHPILSLIERGEGLEDYPKPQSLVDIAYKKIKLGETIVWNQFVPLYLKSSEAEENLRKGLLHIRRLL